MRYNVYFYFDDDDGDGDDNDEDELLDIDCCVALVDEYNNCIASILAFERSNFQSIYMYNDIKVMNRNIGLISIENYDFDI